MPMNIMLFCLDNYGADGFSGKNGTTHAAMMFLSQWLNGFGKTGRLSIESRYIAKEEVNLSSGSALRDALARKGAAVVRLDLEGWHYVLLTGIEGDGVLVFDPYDPAEPFPAEFLKLSFHMPEKGFEKPETGDG